VLEFATDTDIRVFQTFGGFTSGISIHYAPSAITEVTYQSLAPGLPIGQRIVPKILIRAADSRPYELQDLCPADTKFKIIIFLGDLADPAQAERAQKLAEALARPESFLSKYGKTKPGGVGWKAFELLTICATRKEMVNYTDVPAFLRPHWKKLVRPDSRRC
jgi:phenol 2-monooxygenase